MRPTTTPSAFRAGTHLSMLAGAALVLSGLIAGGSTFAAVPEPEPFEATRAEDLRPRINSFEDRVLLLTPAALYRFLPSSESWTVTTSSDGLPPGPFHGFSITEGSLWVNGEGTGVSDLRFDDWQSYGTGEGYPGRMVYDVEADEDYAYAGTDAGAARFDQYILEWETISGPTDDPLGPVSDVAVGDQYVWFALERGVAEYRKDTESLRIDTTLGHLQSPRVLALGQGTRYLYAITDSGIALYDIELRTWTSYLLGTDLPAARVHQLVQQGNDLWLGTDDGLWNYRAESGIWRRDESGTEMPGRQVRSFALAADRIWVVTDQAFAVYELDTARWIDFTASVPIAPAAVSEMAWFGDTLVFLGQDQIVYGLSQDQTNPSLFTYRSHEVVQDLSVAAVSETPGWQLNLDEGGLGLSIPSGADLHLKGGATLFVEDDDSQASGSSGLGEILAETRTDVTLNGRVGENRTISGFYDSTDPDNAAYQLTYRGDRSDFLRSASVGEIDQQLFNSDLTPGTGLRGGQVRAEMGDRSETTRRRQVTVDTWVGKRRTKPGRDVFLGGNRSVTGSTRDIDYVTGKVFPLPSGWTVDHMRRATIYLDDASALTDDANTRFTSFAGIDGAWNKLAPNTEYVIGPRGESLVLTTALTGEQKLVAVIEGLSGSMPEVDLTDSWLRNHYWIAIDPVPGSLQVSVADSNGSYTDIHNQPYIEALGLDLDDDGLVDPDRFSPTTGLLTLPAEVLPSEVYDDPPLNIYTFEFQYQATLNTFQLSHRDLIPGSEQISVDREVLQAGVDYSLIHTSGLFVFYEHILLDEDSVVEVEYLYEVGLNAATDGDDGLVTSAQIGLSPNDHLYGGLSATRWSDQDGRDITTADLNTRLEWKDDNYLLRVTPEVAISRAGNAGSNDLQGNAAGVGLQGRYRGVEISAGHRDLGADFTSFEDRRTLLGRLRKQTQARGLWQLSRSVQAEIEWDRAESDQVSADGVFGSTADSSPGDGRGEESTLTGTVRLLRSGWPNIELRRGRVLIDADGQQQEKWVNRAELELSPDQQKIARLGIRRLWLRAFFQRSDRTFSDTDTDTLGGLPPAANEQRSTDHAFVRLNGSLGTPLSWNVALEDRRTFTPQGDDSQNLRRYQDIDATLQSRPHSSLDAYLRYEADRDLFWHPGGANGGFQANRMLLTTVQFYPGRLTPRLSRLSVRWDVGNTENENGEPGLDLPGGSNLFSDATDFSRLRRANNNILETRLQLFSRVRLIERWETSTGSTIHEGLSTDSDSRQLESRLEIKPRGGLVTVRIIGSNATDIGIETDRRRYFGQWDQTWGNGLLTFFALETQNIESHDALVGQEDTSWNPQARLTWRRERLHIDASLGGSLTWASTEDTSIGAVSAPEKSRKQQLSAILSARPQQNLSIKLQYTWSRTEDAGLGWETDHDVRIRVQVRG